MEEKLDQINILANYIMDEVDGEPSRSEGAGETAIRLIKLYRKALRDIMNELGVPQPEYIYPVVNAYRLAEKALSPIDNTKYWENESNKIKELGNE